LALDLIPANAVSIIKEGEGSLSEAFNPHAPPVNSSPEFYRCRRAEISRLASSRASTWADSSFRNNWYLPDPNFGGTPSRLPAIFL